ncbi:hypothetical protein FB451DRAFT_1246939 [Mycena latifolia]|nr:hypothetical protein FB451DRAFT_1246939 [Mycena latifolia]
MGSTVSFKRDQRNSHYQVLGVDRDATNTQIKEPFFSLSKTHLLNHRTKSEFHEIASAYGVLSRPVYDASLPSIQCTSQPAFPARHPKESSTVFGRGSPLQSHPTLRPPWRTYSTQSPGREPPADKSPRVPDAGDKYHRPPGQRYIPPGPAAQCGPWTTWTPQQRAILERKVSPRLMFLGGLGSTTFIVGSLIGLGWIMNQF